MLSTMCVIMLTYKLIFMKTEQQKKRQSLKIIVSEACMVLGVVITVAILAMMVSGYWVNSDFEVERQGMLQISSTPTGANINIDGTDSSWLERTNMSKVISSGEHTITLSKDGYDTWSKTVNVEKGLLYRLHYPRLFLQDRTKEAIVDVSNTTFAVMSSDHNSLLLANNTTNWQYIKLKSSTITPKTLEISKYFTGVNSDNSISSFTGKIIGADWDYDANHVLFKVENSNGIEWVLLDINDVAKSINLTKEFNSKFSEVKILDDSSSILLAVKDGGLHKINLSDRSISAVIAENVLSFDHYRNEVVFSAQNSDGYYLGYFKLGDGEITELSQTSTPAQVVISKFYDEKYITALTDNIIAVYQAKDFTEFARYETTFAPQNIKVGHDGEFITLSSGNRIATLDMEGKLIREWQADGTDFDWVDNDMIYSINEGTLIVYDYDGLNRRTLAKNVSDYLPVGITDNKWLYYFSDNSLMRESLTESN